MRTCRHTERPCGCPHLVCMSCPVREQADREARTALVRRKAWFKPQFVPYVRKTTHGGDAAVEIGIRGEF